MLSNITSAAANMSGYFWSGLSSPSVTDRMATLVLAEVEGCRADEVADVLDQEQRFVLRLQGAAWRGRPCTVEVAALAGIDLRGRHAGGADALGVVGGLLVAFDDIDRHRALQQLDGLAEQRGLDRSLGWTRGSAQKMPRSSNHWRLAAA